MWTEDKTAPREQPTEQTMTEMQPKRKEILGDKGPMWLKKFLARKNKNKLSKI